MSVRWLTNPITNPMAGPLLILLLAVFGSTALALLALQLRRTAQLNTGATIPITATSEKVLWQRYRTWTIIALLFSGAALTGPLATAVLCAFLCWQGAQEYALLTALPAVHRLVLIASGWVTIAAVLLIGLATLALVPVLAFFAWSIIALLPISNEQETGKRFTTALLSLWGYLYLGWLPVYLLALSMSKFPGLVLLVGLGVALSDVGAFCCGKLLGGPKLAPRLSPHKTWGGLLGNLLGAALAIILTVFALPSLHIWQQFILILVIGLGSSWGDLLESLLKRQRGVKDAGELLPGFGGLLDRIDSLLLVAPLVYYVALFLIG